MKKDTKLILIVLAGILAIVLLCIFAVQGTQNKAFTLEEQVNTAQSRSLPQKNLFTTVLIQPYR